MDNENTPPTPPRISINLDDIKGHEGDASPGGGTPKSSTGWDGKLRLEKKIELVNPEALSDPEYSDEEQVLSGETIEADEGRTVLFVLWMPGCSMNRQHHFVENRHCSRLLYLISQLHMLLIPAVFGKASLGLSR